MKLTTLLITLTILQVSAATYAQKVTLSEKNASILTVFDDIKTQTGYDFMVSSSILTSANKVTIELKDVSLDIALKQIFQDQPLTYQVDDKSILVKLKEISLMDKIKAAFNTIDVRGRVVDGQNIPIPDVNVKTKDESQATTTDKNGYFLLKGIDKNAVLVISSIGYLTKEVNASSDLSLISLEVSNSKLDEVQVIAYGTSTQRLNTGDVTVVGAKEIEQQPVTNPLLALEGRVPGLFISQVNGIPGGGVTVQIRGQNSIQGGNDPLYIVDGVPYTSQLLPGIGYILGFSSSSNNNSTTQLGNPLSYLNPADIESISVLKDAGSTAIYGSRGANGVILITTKKGKAGATKADVNVQSGYGEITRYADLLNTQQYLDMRHEALRNDGITPSLANGDYDLLLWDTTRYTNWQKVFIGNTAQYTNATGTISGGNDLTQFLIGAGYNRQTTVYPGDFADQKASIHVNLNNTSPNKKFSISFTANYNTDANLLPTQDLTYYAYNLAPDAPPLYTPTGALNWEPNSSGTSTFQNPLAGNLSTYTESDNNLIANSILEYKLLPGLSISSNFGYTNLQSSEYTTTPLASYPPETRATSENFAASTINNINSWIIEPQLTYIKTFGKGKLNLFLGSTFEQNNSKGVSLGGRGFSSDQQLGDLAAASNVNVNSYIESIYKYNAVFGRADYNWNDEYLVDFTARRDGSSRFGADNEFHDFGALGLGWIFSKEAIFQNDLTFFSFGKIKGSYGTTGNDQIGDYKYLSLYNSTYAGVSYQGATGLAPASLANPNLQWEVTKKLELSLETGFFKDRILLTASYARDRSSNELLGSNLPLITGFNNINLNFPATVQNTSWEFTLATTNVRTKDFSWTSNFNLTVPQNKLLAFPGLATSTYANFLIVGQPLYISKVYQFEGVDPATGKYMFASTSDKFNPNYSTDENTVINLSPKLYGGFENAITYKRFSLDFLFQFTKQIGVNDRFVQSIPGFENSNEFTTVLDRWQKPGDIATVQPYSTTYNNAIGYYDAATSTAAYSDASYIRLKNLSFSWQVNDSWVKAMRLQRLRVFVQGQDLITITRFEGVDPETGSSGLPPIRILTAGVEIGL